ncbi:hypothetical protein BH23ACT9_BH23ACT9_38350 [soil metagenome]
MLDLGASRPDGTVRVDNRGGTPLTFTAGATAAWLAIGPTGGTLAAGEHRDLTVTAHRDGLGEGDHTGVLRVRSDAGGADVTVRMAIERPPSITSAAVGHARLGLRTDRTSVLATVTDESGLARVTLRWTAPDGTSGSTAMVASGLAAGPQRGGRGRTGRRPLPRGQPPATAYWSRVSTRARRYAEVR